MVPCEVGSVDACTITPATTGTINHFFDTS